MSEKVSDLKSRFSNLAARIGLDISSGIGVSKALLVCLMLATTEQDDNVDIFAMLKSAHVEFSPNCTEGKLRNIYWELSSCFKELFSYVGNRPRRFVALFHHEQIVADWDEFQNKLKCILPKENFVIDAVAGIYYFLCIEKEYRKQNTAKSPYDFNLNNRIFPNEWFRYEFSREMVSEIWNFIFYFQLERITVRIGKELNDIICEYKHASILIKKRL